MSFIFWWICNVLSYFYICCVFLFFHFIVLFCFMLLDRVVVCHFGVFGVLLACGVLYFVVFCLFWFLVLRLKELQNYLRYLWVSYVNKKRSSETKRNVIWFKNLKTNKDSIMLQNKETKKKANYDWKSIN